MEFYPFQLEDLPDEKWVDVENSNEYYRVSTFGRLLSLHGEPHIMKPHMDTKGYLQYQISINGVKRRFNAHRLVAKHFTPNPQNLPEVNHEDGNRYNNHVDNLKWVTRSENRLHAYSSGLQERRYNSKLTDDQVRYIRRVYNLHNRNFGMAALSRKFNVSVTVIRRILKGNSYRTVI